MEENRENCGWDRFVAAVTDSCQILGIKAIQKQTIIGFSKLVSFCRVAVFQTDTSRVKAALGLVYVPHEKRTTT